MIADECSSCFHGSAKEGNKSVEVLWRERNHHERLLISGRFQREFFDRVFGREAARFSTEIGAFNYQQVEFASQFSNESSAHSRFTPVEAQIPGVKEADAAVFDQQCNSPIGGVVHRVSGHAEVTDQDGCAVLA